MQHLLLYGNTSTTKQYSMQIDPSKLLTLSAHLIFILMLDPFDFIFLLSS